MNIADLKQENSRKIAEEVIKSLKLDEDSGVGITGKFVFCFERDDDYLQTVVNAPPLMLLQVMDRVFEVLQEKSPMIAYLAKGVFRREFSEKEKYAD